VLQAHNFVFDPPLQVCFEHMAVHDVQASFAAAQQPFRIVPASVSGRPVIPRPLHGDTARDESAPHGDCDIKRSGATFGSGKHMAQRR